MDKNLALILSMCLGAFNVALHSTEEFYRFCEQEDQTGALQYIREHPACVTQTYEGHLPLHMASFFGLIDVVCDLLANDNVDHQATVASIDGIATSGCNALHLAALQGHLAVVECLLRRSTISHNSIITGNSKGFDGYNTLHLAARFGHHAVIECLLRQSKIKHDSVIKGNSDGWEGYNALHIAALIGHCKVIGILLQAGADINAKDNNDTTALMRASLANKAEVVEALLQAGANINAKDNHGITALMSAAMKGNGEVIEILLKIHANINAKDKRGLTALMHTTLRGQTETARALVEAGADVNAEDEHNRTALFYAVTLTEYPDKIIDYFLTACADKLAWHKPGNIMAIAYAQRKYVEIIPKLLAAYEKHTPNLSVPRKSCYITFEQNDHNDSITTGSFTALLTKTTCICSDHILKKLCSLYPTVQKNIEHNTWSLFQSNHTKPLYIVVPENVADAATLHTNYGMRTVTHITPANIAKVLTTQSTRATSKELIESFSSLLDAVSPQHPTRFILQGHGEHSIVAAVPLDDATTLFSLLAEADAEFLMLASCHAAGDNLIKLQGIVQHLWTQHQRASLIRQSCEKPAGSSEAKPTISAQPLVFNGIIIIEATSDIAVAGKRNVGAMFRELDRVVTETANKLTTSQPVKYISKQSLLPVLQACGCHAIDTLASVRLSGPHSFFRPVDCGDTSIVTWSEIQKLRVEKLLLPLLVKRGIIPATQPTVTRLAPIVATPSSAACAASSSAPALPEATDKPMQSTGSSSLIPFPMRTHDRYIELFPADMCDCAWSINALRDVPVLISKGPGHMQHFIGGIEYTSEHLIAEGALKDFTEKAYQRFYDNTSEGLTHKAWFIKNFTSKTRAHVHTIERLGIMVPAGSKQPITTYLGHDGIPQESLDKIKDWLKKPQRTIDQLPKDTVGRQDKLVKLIQWYAATQPSEATLYEATAGQESRTTLWECFEKFLQ